MFISFNIARKAGLTLLVSLIIVISLSFVSSTMKITKTVHENLELRTTQIAKLEKIKDLFDRVYRNYSDYLLNNIDDLPIVIESVNKLIKEGMLLKEIVDVKDRDSVDSIIRNSKRLKTIISFYAYGTKEDPTGATAIESEIALKESELLLFYLDH